MKLNSQRLAWGVLLISFAIFCLFCLFMGMGVNYFLFQSMVPVESSIVVGRGTAGVTGSDLVEQVERAGRSVSGDTVIRTDAQSQVALAFRDNDSVGTLLAAVTLKSNTAITMRSALRPRFDWATSGYMITLDNVSGDLDVLVPPSLPLRMRVSLRTRDGMLIFLDGSGRYTVSVSDEQIRVINQTGSALLIALNSTLNRAVPVQTEAIYQTQSPEINLVPTRVELVENSTFADVAIAAEDDDTTQILPLAWGCANGPNNMPRGSYGVDLLDGRRALRLVRGNDADSHGATFCKQVFGPGQSGLEVRDYANLNLRASVYINYHSLSACGTEASECPLTLKMDYIDINGIARQWFHGFYSFFNPQLEYPLRCSSCTLDHEIINEKAWYLYDSGNLFALLPPDQRPRSILNVQFYASGHQYDVYVGEVSLLTGGTETVVARE